MRKNKMSNSVLLKKNLLLEIVEDEFKQEESP